jgi:TRAP-type mannitol/chloroaromatic compound transport system permease large subunit
MTILLFLGVLVGAIALGMPVAFALVLTGVALMYQLDFFNAQLVAQNMLAGADIYPLLAVPCFILAGELMNAGGISRRIITLASSMVGHIRGGLGFVAIAATLLTCPSCSPARRRPTPCSTAQSASGCSTSSRARVWWGWFIGKTVSAT